MKMILRWFGPGADSVPLAHIRQIPGVCGVAATLMDKPAGALWEEEEIEALKRTVEAAGLSMQVIESVNIHDDIKLGLPSREKYIENYIQTVLHLGRAGVRVICYNFMPVFDWMRTDLWKPLPDGSFTMAYEHAALKALGDDPQQIVERFQRSSGGFSLPGWEPERLAAVKELFRKYAGITHDDLIEHLRYFLLRILPACEQAGVCMAIHPDDPPWDIFGLPRVFKDGQSAREILSAAPHPCNGLTFCTGSLGVSPQNDLPALIREFGGHIPFAHVRNFFRGAGRDFYESSHLTGDGSLDMLEIVRALHESAPDCYIRPDHGRMLWGERARPGYGLYDRALGASYLGGMWETLERIG